MYLLISVFEREIYTEKFNTKEEAAEKMKQEMLEGSWCKTWDELKAKYEFGNDYEFDCEVTLDGWSNFHGNNYDWRIIKI